MTEQLADDTENSQDDIDPIPLADKMMKRGEFLRQLRQMEVADQAEREQTQQEEVQKQEDVIDVLSNGKQVLRYDSYLAHQRYYDDLKHVDCHYIDYGNILNDNDEQGRLVIEQDKSLGKGGLSWDAAFILAEHLIEYQSEWNTVRTSINNETSIVELGSGTGLCGLMIAKAVNECHVRITDLPELLPLTARNVARNFPLNHSIKETTLENEEFLKQLFFPSSNNASQGDDATTRTIHNARDSRGTISASVLRWGKPQDYQQVYDIVLGADVVASLYDPIALADTMHALCHDESIVYVSYKGRLSGPHEHFEERLSSLFEKVERIRPISRNKNPQVWILKATGKKGYMK